MAEERRRKIPFVLFLDLINLLAGRTTVTGTGEWFKQ